MIERTGQLRFLIFMVVVRTLIVLWIAAHFWNTFVEIVQRSTESRCQARLSPFDDGSMATVYVRTHQSSRSFELLSPLS